MFGLHHPHKIEGLAAVPTRHILGNLLSGFKEAHLTQLRYLAPEPSNKRINAETPRFTRSNGVLHPRVQTTATIILEPSVRIGLTFTMYEIVVLPLNYDGKCREGGGYR